MSTLDAPDNRRKKGGRQVARPNRPWTQTGLASRPAYNAAGVMLTRADMKELGSTDNNSEDGEYDARRDAALSYDVAIAEMRRRKEWRDKLTAAKRVEFIGNCMMIQGDCLEVMPQIGKVDAILCDPPFGIKRDGGFGGFGGFGKPIARREYAGNWDSARPHNDAFSLMLESSPVHIIWGGQYFADLLPAQGKWLWWDKCQTMPTYGDGELAWTSLPGVAPKKFVYSNNGLHAKERDKQHPTQKPIALMRWCLGFLPNAKTILDPFMGSGTTGVACIKTGRHFIGIELDPDYFEIACRRVREAYAQPDLLIDAPKAAPQVQEAFEL